MSAPFPAASLSVSELVSVVAATMTAEQFSAQSTARLVDLMRRFSGFADRGSGITGARDVTQAVVEGFVHARSADGSLPAVATMHIRRAAVRVLFAEGRRLGLVWGDPTLDVRLPPRTSLRTRPLTDEEVALCRSHSIATLTETRQPAAWALAEATARSSELAGVLVRDVQIDLSRVWLSGSAKIEPRWGQLSEWGRLQVDRRLGHLDGPNLETPLICPGARPGVNATSSASIAIALTLRRAGLHAEPDVRPSSVAAWAGAQALASGASIDAVALMLGIRSLDRAAAFIGFDWRRAD